jgi:hypothetical protein
VIGPPEARALSICSRMGLIEVNGIRVFALSRLPEEEARIGGHYRVDVHPWKGDLQRRRDSDDLHRHRWITAV